MQEVARVFEHIFMPGFLSQGVTMKADDYVLHRR